MGPRWGPQGLFGAEIDKKSYYPSKPLNRPSRSHRAAPQKPYTANFETNIFKFWWFLGPSDQIELYNIPFLSKL